MWKRTAMVGLQAVLVTTASACTHEARESVGEKLGLGAPRTQALEQTEPLGVAATEDAPEVPVDPCPFTERGALELLDGCSAADLMRHPAAVFDEANRAVREARRLLAVRGLEDARRLLDEVTTALRQGEVDLLRGQPCDAADTERKVDALLSKIESEVDARTVLAERHEPATRLGEEDALTSPEARYTLALRLSGRLLAQETAAIRGQLAALPAACRALSDRLTLRGEVAAMSPGDHTFKLSDGTRFVLPTLVQGAAKLVPGSKVNVTGYGAADGLNVASSIDVVGGGLDKAEPEKAPDGPPKIPCTSLAVVPVQRMASGLVPTFHGPLGYRDDKGVLQLEAGTSLALQSVLDIEACPGISSEGYPLYRRANIVVSIPELAEDGWPTEFTIATGISDDGTIVSLPGLIPAISGLMKSTLIVTHYTQVCKPGLGIYGDECAAPVIVGQETRPFVVWDEEQRAGTLEYDATIVGVSDNGVPGDSESLALKGVAELAPAMSGATIDRVRALAKQVAAGNVSEQWIEAGGKLAVFAKDATSIWADPKASVFVSKYLATGQYRAGALRWARIEGTRGGHPFWYSASTPHVVRDRIADCELLAGATVDGFMMQSVEDSFYDIPYECLVAPGMGNGNIDDPESAHGSNQAYAFDFGASGGVGQSIRAARGGIIADAVENDPGPPTENPPPCGGNYVMVRHQDGTFGVYYHLNLNSAAEIGSLVHRGHEVGEVGMTGCTSGPHVHFEPTSAPTSDNAGVRSRYRAHVSGVDETCYIPRKGDKFASLNKPVPF